MNRRGKAPLTGRWARTFCTERSTQSGEERGDPDYPGSLPKYLRPVDYWQLPEAFVMFRDSCPKLFWDPPLFYDPNPLASGAGGAVLSLQNPGNRAARQRVLTTTGCTPTTRRGSLTSTQTCTPQTQSRNRHSSAPATGKTGRGGEHPEAF